MTINILLYGFGLVALVGQEQKCDATEVHSAATVLEILIEDWFPQNIEFNESCVAEGCPDLKNISLCPSDLEINALRNITKTLSDCMTGPICGIVIDPRPLKYLMVTMDELLPGEEVSAIVTLVPGTGFLSNISNIQLDMMSSSNQHLPLEMSMLMPNIRIRGYYHMDFRLKTVFGPDLTASLTQLIHHHEIQFVSIFSINNTGPNLDINIVNPIINVSPQLCGIDLPAGFPNVQTLLTTSVRALYETSTMAKAIGRFIGKLYKSAVKVISRNCKSLNI